MTYETQIMNFKNFSAFKSFFNAEIGTEFDTNPSGNDDGSFYAVCFDLTPADIKKLQAYEN